VKIVAAPAAFKGSLSPAEAATAMIEGARRAAPDADLIALPVADGGEGTVAALVAATGGHLLRRQVTGPLGDPVEAEFGLLPTDVIPSFAQQSEESRRRATPRSAATATAVIEMASAAGLSLVPQGLRDPRVTTTRGLGELIVAALDAGCRRLIVGIGGSASNDGGAGMAQVLGARLLDAGGRALPPGGAALARLARIDVSRLDPRLAQCETVVACDVDNPLIGPQGASAVYGPQKGATPEMVAELDAALSHYAAIIARDLGKQVADRPGAGAAGGLGAGLMAFLDAEARPGVDVVLEAMRFRERIAGADLILTGEGRLDAQTLRGKAVAGVSRIARETGIPVIALAGRIDLPADDLQRLGVATAHTMVPSDMAESDAVARAVRLLSDAAERALASWPVA
jgi:glycerate kinase